ncbi:MULTISPECIES: MerR family transcriptional regulator [unclassified Nocardioides]|uniref:MerR family transcriptional regulator n=1 Tax=unclassified Nocardioides TaxID=2615069 RepID=UPI0007024E4D|nr:MULTISPECIES: MerR family transcriptional regulator [unclassified Nocardioides]KRC53038.1 MerR family transcriptional regulator [Nocardioides sp. Root79]KRC72567.1 MerR family transcriptional regulator [Nocardioides sp. Root240]
MLIKDLAERAGVSVKAVRYYESRGLITPERAANGYREYDDGDVLVVREIRALLSLGLTADETVPFVECLRAGNDRADVCPASLDAYRLRIAEIDRRIEELSKLRGELSGLLDDAESYPTTTHQEKP